MKTSNGIYNEVLNSLYRLLTIFNRCASLCITLFDCRFQKTLAAKFERRLGPKRSEVSEQLDYATWKYGHLLT